MAVTRRRRTRAESQAETRSRLLEAAGIVFRRRGFQAASIEAITAEAGFSRGAFYSNFANKEELFIELLHERVYTGFTALLEGLERSTAPPLEQLRDGAAQLARNYEGEQGRWLFELWLELLAHAARDKDFARLAAGFWSGNRALIADMSARNADATGNRLPVDAKHLASAQIALDIGLAVQHLVDPDAVPLELYPQLFEALFGRFVTPAA